MMDEYQMKAFLSLMAYCGLAGIPWLIAHGVSCIVRSHRHATRFAVMTGFTFLWILWLVPATGRGHWEALPYVMSIAPWWLAIVIGIVIEKKKDGAETGSWIPAARSAQLKRRRNDEKPF